MAMELEALGKFYHTNRESLIGLWRSTKIEFSNDRPIERSLTLLELDNGDIVLEDAATPKNGTFMGIYIGDIHAGTIDPSSISKRYTGRQCNECGAEYEFDSGSFFSEGFRECEECDYDICGKCVPTENSHRLYDMDGYFTRFDVFHTKNIRHRYSVEVPVEPR